jgi:hypothetical protein
MYDQAKVLEQAYGTYRSLLKEGATNPAKAVEAREFLEDNRDKLAKYRSVEHVKRAESRLNERILLIERSNMDPEMKKTQISAINHQKDQIARMVN